MLLFHSLSMYCLNKMMLVYSLFHAANLDVSVALAWSVESLPSNPTGPGILISVLGLGVCPLYVFSPVLSSAEALKFC